MTEPQDHAAGGEQEGLFGHLLDSRVLGSLFASQELRAAFADRATLQSWLDVEVALVQAQAEMGLVPEDAARQIEAGACADDWDLDAMSGEIQRTGHPLVPAIRELTARAGSAGAWVHLGATTQDIMDTGLVLQCRRALDLVDLRLDRLVETLLGLAQRYRDLPMMGRTHAQHALPITLGFKFAVLLAETDRHRERLQAARSRVLVGQLGGAVGSLASFGPRGPEVVSRTMARLGLPAPHISWHTARDGLTELVCVLSMVSATCGKIANEIRVLQRTEVSELEEPFSPGRIGSSTMPHKRNPMFAEFIISNAIITRSAPTQMLTAMLQEHERDMTMWGVEWAVVPETFVLTGGLLERADQLLDGLVVHEDAIRRNLHQLGDLVLSEAAMMHLASRLGKDEAHEVVYQASMQAWDTKRTLRECLLDVPAVAAATDAATLDALLTPESYLGSCQVLVDDVVKHVLSRAESSHVG
ncbi:MAG: 3-carboxy-cis,cis-muconate cycloisomerase [Actinomycetota bacterium]|nr:3-carboxy-cis,cis-muconate cycloisomerase [Actinomycetota bacterium]